MALEDFEKKEKSILNNIKEDGQNLENGLISRVPSTGSEAGYLIFLTQPEVAKYMEKFSTKIYDALKGRTTIFGTKNAHQTLADYGITQLDSLDADEFPNNSVIEKLSYATESAFKKFKEVDPLKGDTPWTMFFNYINNKDSVILAPQENRGNYDLIKIISEMTSKQGINTREPWGRHMSVSKVTEPIPAQELGDFKRIMTDESIFPNVSADGDLFYAKALNVGYFVINKEGFNLKTIESFDFF